MRTWLRSLFPGLVLVGLILTALNTPASAGRESFLIQVDDLRGKKIVCSKPVNRIVCLLDSALTGLFMLGVEDKVVGVTLSAYTGTSSSYYASMDSRIRQKTLPIVSHSKAGSLERIIALRPDLVITWSVNKEIIEVLEARGIPVFGVFIDGVEDIYRELLALGALTGTRDRARQIVDFTKMEIERVRQKTAGLQQDGRPRAYFMWAGGELDSSGRPSIVQELMDIAGVINICGHMEQEHVVINMEDLLVSDPQILVMWSNPLLDPSDLIERPVFRNMSAVKNGRIHEFPGLFICDLCSLNFQFSAKLLAAWSHPKLFNRNEMEQEIVKHIEILFGSKLPETLILERLGREEPRP